SQMVARTTASAEWPDGTHRYLQQCLGLPNYASNLQRFGITPSDMASSSGTLVDALVVGDEPPVLQSRIEEQLAAGADHVMIQLVPPARADVVCDWIAARLVCPRCSARGRRTMQLTEVDRED